MVKTALQTGCRRIAVELENIDSILESFSDAAERMERSECKKSVDETKKCFKGLLETQAQLKALHDAMERMEITYATPESEKETDFKDILEARGQEAGISNFNAEEHPLYIKLLKDLQDVHSDDEEPAEEDDDLQIDRSNKSLARNLKCPLSGLELMSIKDPVQDQIGFVYERECIVDYIRRTPSGSVKAPIAGANHEMTIADIKPAKKVIREQRRARNQPTQTQRADEGDIMDVA